MLLSASLEAAFRAATETPDAPAGTRILSRLRAALDGAGLRSRVRPEDPEVECGLRLGRNAAVLVAVNHRAEAVTTRVRLGDLGFVPANAVDATSGKPLALERVPAAGAKGAPAAKGGAAAPALAVRLSLPARNGAVVVLYPQRLASVRVKAEAPTVARGETLRYRVQVLGADGRPARGTHALDATVADARGQVRARYGGPVATQDGAFTFAVPVAVNAALGAWRIHVREATTGAQANAAFGVR